MSKHFSKGACPYNCGAQKGQHSLLQAGKCDAIKAGKLAEWEAKHEGKKA